MYEYVKHNLKSAAPFMEIVHYVKIYFLSYLENAERLNETLYESGNLVILIPSSEYIEV